jgi:hypothetical protein
MNIEKNIKEIELEKEEELDNMNSEELLKFA